MAYPEPTPVLRGKDAKEFVKKLDSFQLDSSQKARWKGARETYQKLKPKDEKP
jgi:hypothetical protein